MAEKQKQVAEFKTVVIYKVLYYLTSIIKEQQMSDKEILASLEAKRTKCVVYTRVMGYHRPVESFNLGKKGEHKERVKFCEPKSR